MKINVCVPTRSKNVYLGEFPVETASRAVLPGTRVVLGFDHDDPLRPQASAPIFDHPRILGSVAPREDSLGEKYNRCARAYEADLYIMSMDDASISTPGWDEILAKHLGLFKDGIGYLYIGREPNGEYLPSMIAVTRRVVELVGFCPEFFPFWWNNMWVNEVATLIGGVGHRIVGVPLETRYPSGPLPEPARRDVSFWAAFFDHTRAMRVDQANKLISEMDDGPTAKAVLKAIMRPRLQELALLNSRLRDPDFAKSMVRVTEDLDPRHARLRAQATAIMDQLTTKAA